MTAQAATLPSNPPTHPASASASQLYPAPRTANAFSLPFARLSEPVWACRAQHSAEPRAFAEPGPDKAAAAAGESYFLLQHQQHKDTAVRDEAKQPLHSTEEFSACSALIATANMHAACASLPVPLRALPFWYGTTGPRKCIIYLEPRRSSPLYVAIEGFLRASADLFGPSEAHQYHPHSSMTGFIDIADGTDGEAVATSGQLITQIACHLHAFVTSAAKGKLGGQLSSGDGQTADASLLAVPTVGPVSAAPDYPHKGTHKIEVALDTPAGFRTIVDALKAAVPQARIRGKRIGHISLAYYNKHVKTANLLTADMAERLIALAASFFASPHISAPSTNLWDIAFYELAFNSSSLSVPHRFNQIARWQL